MHIREEQIIRNNHPFQPVAGMVAGLIIAVWFLMFPRGIPWSSVNFFSAAVIGRVMPDNVSFISATLLHFVLGALYGLAIAAVVRRMRPELSILAGALTGLALYFLNWALVKYAFPWAYGRESAVLIAHLLFGAFTAGAYRGLISRRRVPVDDSTPIAH